MKLAITFPNFGPYHLARLRALAWRLGREGGRLLAYETAGQERKYAWRVDRSNEPFEWLTLFPGRALESLTRGTCRQAMLDRLARDQPDALAIVGYVRPEALAALDWAEREGRPTILMSESQAIDRPRIWWKEAIKRRRVRRFGAALVGGPSHREYLVQLGLPRERIVLGYNAVDHSYFRDQATMERARTRSIAGFPSCRYFLSVCRFVPEKNLTTLIRAYHRYVASAPENQRWDLVLCGHGPEESAIDLLIRQTGLNSRVHRPGFLQVDLLPRWYARASAFVLPSLSEPWGLVANEAAASGLPLLVSNRCGCAEPLVPDPPGTTGWRFDPTDEEALAELLRFVAQRTSEDLEKIGRRAAGVAEHWGPERFASGTLEALDLARAGRRAGRPNSIHISA